MREVTVFCSDVINSLGLVRTLGEAGHNVECFCYGKYTDYILSSKYITVGMGFKTCEEAVNYLITDYPIKKEKPILFTIPDPPAYYTDINQTVLSTKFIIFSAGAPGHIVFWMDKQNISELARKHGLTVPWTVRISKNDSIPDNLAFPVFIKSANSTAGGKIDEGICHSKEELFNRISGAVSDHLVIMPFIKKKREVNFFGIAIKDRVYIDYYDVRERFPEDGYGYYNAFYQCDYDDLHERMANMIRETHYQGLFDVEFLVGEDESMYFTEVNFRVDGEVYKLALGIDLPEYWCNLVELNENDLPARLITKRHSFVGITEVDDFRVSVLSKKVNPFLWLWQFVSADRRMLINFKDPKPVFIKLLGVIKRRLN